MAEEVLVVRTELLPRLPSGGVIEASDLLSRLLSRAEFLPRDQAEADPAFKQLIPYSVLRHGDDVFQYQRSAWGGERRLHGQRSIGVGGHINRSDVLPLWSDVTPIVEWARDRELAEEFDVASPGQPRLVGFLNDDTTEVGRVHLGVVYEYWLDHTLVKPREKRVHLHFGFVSIAELAAHVVEYESWSQFIIAQYLGRG
jgi:predicted NUDIX family phosphoesterase